MKNGINVIFAMGVICLQLCAIQVCGQGKSGSEETDVNAKYQELLTNIVSFAQSKNLDQLKDSVREIEIFENMAGSGPVDGSLVRQRKVELCLATLHAIAVSKDANFNVNDPPERNIPPPEGGYSAGVAPESIKDERVRMEYETAIARNTARIASYNLQYRLRQIENHVLKKTEEFVSKGFSDEPGSRARLIEYFNRYEIDKDTRTKLLDHLKSATSDSP